MNNDDGFKTARGDVIKLSKEALSRAVKLFDDICKESNNYLEESEAINKTEASVNIKSSTDESSFGFAIPGGRASNVSDKSLQKADNTLNEISEEANEGTHVARGRNNAFKSPVPQKTTTDTSINNKNEFSFGFATASGNAISVSDKSLRKANKMFTEISKETNEETHTVRNRNSTFKSPVPQKTSIDTSINNKNEFSFGFATASGNAISVSDKSLRKANKMFTEISKETNEETHTVRNRNSTFKSPVPQKTSIDTSINNKNEFSFGFATASGSAISVSYKSLRKANKMFIEISKETNEETHTVRNRNSTFKSPVPQKTSIDTSINNKNEFSFGFAAASGSAISVSDKSSRKANKMFTEISKETNEETHTVRNKNSTFKSPVPQKTSIDTSINNKNEFSFGFAAASGSAISVSDKSLRKANKMFTEISKEKEETCSLEDESDLYDTQIQTGHSQCLKLMEDQDLNKEILEGDSGNPGSSSALFKPLQKRKIDSNERVTLNKWTREGQFKKLRFSNESTVSTFVSESLKETLIIGENQCNTKDNINSTSNDKVVDSYLINHEVEASNNALLLDEQNSNGQWAIPKETRENENTESTPSSPVMGGRFNTKKRRKREGKVQEERRSICTDSGKLNGDIMKEKSNENQYSTEKRDSELQQNNCDTLDSNEFGDSPLLMMFINQSTTISERRSEIASEQDKEIRLKQTNKPKPTISKLYFHKKSNSKNRVSWNEISRGSKPVPCTYDELIKRKLPSDIFDLTADNAINYKFACGEFYGQDFVQNNVDGIKMEDNVLLVMDENGHAGITEIKRAFLASPGIDPNLVPAGWVENHYKWIVWKLASMDRIKLGSIVLPRALTPNQVIMQLKYRYYREVDRFQRPALRKILEKDDSSIKRMVLCISSIIERDDPSIKLVLTDGWYSVRASVDLAMIRHIASGKVREGTKLLTYGSVLQNCDQGYAPLEVPDCVSLKIHTNSTRRTKWDMRLGYVTPSGPFCVKLSTIDINGGLIGKIKVTIVRVYPMLYHEKTSSNESIFRNERCEEKASNAYEKERVAMIDSFYADVEKYFDQSKVDSQADSIELAAYAWNEDRDRLCKNEFFSEQEFEEIQNNCRMKEEQFRMKLESRLQKSLPPPRQVTPVLRVRVVEGETIAELQIWSPSEEVMDILKEGTHISVSNLMPAGRRGNELRLSANRSSEFKKLNISRELSFSQRTCTLLSSIEKSIFAPSYGEFDTIGIIVYVGTEPYGMKNFEAVHLAYPRSDSESSYLSILFWQGISSYGYAEILTVGKLVACTNLEWRRATPWSIPMSYCTERTSFTRNPRPSYLQQPFEDLKRSITDIDAYVSACTAEISEEVQKRPTSRLSDGHNFNKSPLNDSVKRFANQTSQDFFEQSLLTDRPARSPAIQKRLERLRSKDEAPRLSPIVITNTSRRVSLPFQSPLRSGVDNRTKIDNRTSLGTKFT